MSAALYRDTVVSAYGNTPLPADNCTDLGIINGNRLNLLPEHGLIIYARCLEHLAKCQLPNRCVRVFCILLNQTIGFKKLEDNINNTRLEQLTKIRYDHAGQTMKDLADLNIIIRRIGGKYRNWLSINFNLETWGKANISAEEKSNDPTILLPREYTQDPIDQGIPMDIAGLKNEAQSIPSESADNLLDSPVKKPDSSIEEAIPAVEKPIVEKAIPIIETPIVETGAIETVVVKSESKTAEPVAEPSSKVTEATLQQTMTTLFNEQISPVFQKITARLQKIEQKISHSPHNPDHRIDPPLEKQIVDPIETDKAQMEQTHQIKPSVQTSGAILDLRYPHQLSAQEREGLQDLLHKSEDQAQNLLNLLAKRFENTHNPVNNPISYFASLVTRLRKKNLDLSAAQHYQIPDPQQKQQEQLVQSLQQQYAECQSDYQHFERIVKTEMGKTGKSFTESCSEMGMEIIFKNIETQRTEVTQALDHLLSA